MLPQQAGRVDCDLSVADGECQAAIENVTMKGTMLKRRLAMGFSKAHELSLRCDDAG
jgi:hypothetical protein